MTLQISPVLAGTFDAPNYGTPNNLASTQADDADATDSRRYTKFDHSATDAGSTTDFSFDDFVDMINPLEHIPIISSIYREITGETINPVARTVGNIIYGGAMGIASGILAAAGAAGDSVIQESTGKDSTGNVIAALFGPDKPAATTQLASADTPQTPTAATPAATSAQTPAQSPAQTSVQTSAQINARAKLMASSVAAAAASAVQQSMPSTGTSSPAAQMAGASAAGSGLLNQLMGNQMGGNQTGLPVNGAKAFALDPNKLPYGGVMAPPLQGNNMAIALAQAAPGGMQMNHTVYTGRIFNGVRPSLSTSSAAPQTASSTPAAAPASFTPATSTPPAPAAPASAPPAAPLSLPPAPPADSYVSTAAPDELPASLMSDIAALRAINQYRSTANQNGSSGANVNVIN